MLAKIVQTIFSKGLISICNFLVVMITAQYLGADGRGNISIMFLNITVILLFNDVIGGSSLVYLTPRREPWSLLLPAVTVGLFTGIILPLLFHLYFHFQRTELFYFIALTLLSNFSSISNYFLNGFQKIRQNNLASILQALTILASLLIEFFVLKKFSVFAYYRALAFGYGVNLLFSIFSLKGDFKRAVFSWKESFKVIAGYGLAIQAGNIFQLLNYRFSYYVLDGVNDPNNKHNVGVFSTAASVSEAVWVIMNGIAMVQYASLSASNDPVSASKITLKLSKISFALTTLALLALVLLPDVFFTTLFGKDFSGMKQYCVILAPGIAFAGLTGIYSHYFSGQGDMKTSAFSSLVGLIVTLGCSLFLIPAIGPIGAAITCTASYIASSLFLIFMFRIQSGSSFYDMFLNWKKLLPLTDTR